MQEAIANLLMRILLTLTCCVGLALFAGAAQNDDQNNNQKKKKGGGNAQQQQVVTPQTGKHYKTGPGTGPHVQTFQQQGTAQHKNAQKWQGTGQGNVSPAHSTTFNKTKTVNKNITVNKNYKVQHFNLGNQPSGKYTAVKFNQNYHIAGAQNWKGQKYVVFKNYHPQWHDQWWWNQHHHNHIVIVFGAPYFWDAGYWYPAWGYDPGANYYFDGPIYASNPEMDPGQVVANVQSALQQQDYYHGEIDGVLGQQTREALAEYQSAHGLEPTGAVDEPTLETLGMA
jgi:hypothetical protein